MKQNAHNNLPELVFREENIISFSKFNYENGMNLRNNKRRFKIRRSID